MRRAVLLRGDRRAEHVQDLVSPVAELSQALRRLPDLGRIVAGDLGRDDLVHAEMEARIQLAAVECHGLPVGVELGVRDADQFRAVIPIGGIQPRRGPWIGQCRDDNARCSASVIDRGVLRRRGAVELQHPRVIERLGSGPLSHG